jgi:hypothetical protein
MRWVTIKPIAAQRVSKAANKSFIDIQKKPVAMLRAQQMLAEAPPEMRLPRAVMRFIGSRFHQFPTR